MLYNIMEYRKERKKSAVINYDPNVLLKTKTIICGTIFIGFFSRTC